MSSLLSFISKQTIESKPILVKARPKTPGTRHQRSLKFVKNGIQWSPKEVTLAKGKTGGRNQSGVLVTRHIGGGNKQRTRKVQPLWPGHRVLILGTQWDPKRTSPLSLVLDLDTLTASKPKRSYVLTGDGMKSGLYLEGPVSKEIKETKQSQGFDESSIGRAGTNEFCAFTVVTTLTAVADQDHLLGDSDDSSIQRSSEILPNTRCKRSWVPVGSQIYDRSMDPSNPMKSTRFKASGVFGTVLAHGFEFGDGRLYSKIRCPSGEERRIPSSTYATVGKVSCEDHSLEIIGKAGKRRALGIRPTVRGCAMNPVDHPHGGRTKGGRHDVTPWAMIAKGQATRKDEDRSPFVLKTARQNKHGYLPSLSADLSSNKF